MYEGLKQKKELWDLYTKEEEYNPFIPDKHERFRYYLSRHRNIFEPQVSKFFIENGCKVSYPENKKFAVCLTHDIDVLYLPKLTSIFESYKSFLKGQIITSLNQFKPLINKKYNPWWNIKKIIEIEERYNAKSSFYFLTLEKNEIDFNFTIDELEPEITYIYDNGCEVGLHGGFGEYNNADKIVEKRKRLEKILGKKVVGYRNHYIKFKTPDTWEILSKAGFLYDTTFGYADCVGFRNGMCHPFKPYNLKTEKEIDILEIPLVIMDCTLFEYMHLEIDEAWKTIKMLIDTVERYYGVITILWHNTYMIDKKYELYEKILSYCVKRNAWLTTCHNVAKWWKDQPNFIH